MSVTVTGLFVYPVKSMRGAPRARVRLAPTGFEWDRQWMVIDSKGMFLSQRTHPKLARIVPEVADATLKLNAPGMAGISVPFTEHGERIAVRVQKDACVGVEQGAAAHDWVSEALGAPVRALSSCA